MTRIIGFNLIGTLYSHFARLLTPPEHHPPDDSVCPPLPDCLPVSMDWFEFVTGFLQKRCHLTASVAGKMPKWRESTSLPVLWRDRAHGSDC